MSAIFRTGDIVGLTGKVRHDCRPDEDSGRVFVDIDGHHSALWLKLEQVTLIAPRIDVGEVVEAFLPGEGETAQGEVVASDGEYLWVKRDRGDYATWPAKAVKIVPPKTIAIDGPVDQDMLDRLKAEMEKPRTLEMPEPPPAPLDGKVGSEGEVSDVA